MRGTGLSLLLAAAAVLGMQTQPRAQTAADVESLLHELLDEIATRAPGQDLALFGPPRLRPLGEDWSGRLPAFRWRLSDGAIGNVLAVEAMPVTVSVTPEGQLVLAFSPPATFEIGSDRTAPPGAPTARGNLRVRPNASWRPIAANVAIVPPLRALMGVHIEAADIVLPRDAFAETRAASGAIALTSTFRGDRRHDQEFRVTVDGARVTAPSLDLALAHAEAWMRLDAARLDSFWVWGAGFASFEDWAGRPGDMAPDQEAAMLAAMSGDEAVVDGIANGVEVTGLRADWLAQTILADSAALGFTVTGLRTGNPTVEVAASVSGLEVAGPGSPIDPDLVPRHAIAEIAVTGLDFHDYALSVGRMLGAWADVPTPYDAVNLAFGQVLAFDGWDTGARRTDPSSSRCTACMSTPPPSGST